MELLIFFIGFLNFLILGARGVFIASELKRHIQYEGSSLSLYYLVQNQVFSTSLNRLNISTCQGEVLLHRCKVNIKVMYGIGLVCVIGVFSFV